MNEKNNTTPTLEPVTQHPTVAAMRNAAGARSVLDALALAAGPGGVVAVDGDELIAVHQDACSDDACNCDQAIALTAALRQLVVAIGDGRVLNMSQRCGAAYNDARATLRRFDGAHYHAATVAEVSS